MTSFSFREGKPYFNFHIRWGRIKGFYIYLFGYRLFYFWGNV